MNKGKILASLGRIVLSGLLAFIALTVFCYFYYNVPVHAAADDGATDYKWEANVFYSRGTEGFAWGKTNNEGYINLFDYTPDTQVDVLIMGSSHMEAFHMASEESAASRLDALLPNDIVYNIGVSGHNFLPCVSNLEAAINKYQPSKYVVIETASINFSDEDLTKAIDGTVPEMPSHTDGIVKTLQKNQYLRLVYAQLQNFAKRMGTDEADARKAAQKTDTPKTNDEALLDGLLSKLSRIAQEGNTQLILLYHPGIKISEDATMQITGNADSVLQFERLCAKNNIIFLDMSERFLQEYENSYTLPYGFANSTVGSGHLNKYGHAMIADELYKLIGEVE